MYTEEKGYFLVSVQVLQGKLNPQVLSLVWRAELG